MPLVAVSALQTCPMPTIIPTHYSVTLAPDSNPQGGGHITLKVMEDTDVSLNPLFRRGADLSACKTAQTFSIETGSNLEIVSLFVRAEGGEEIDIPLIDVTAAATTGWYAHRVGEEEVSAHAAESLQAGQILDLDLKWEIDFGARQRPVLEAKYVFPQVISAGQGGTEDITTRGHHNGEAESSSLDQVIETANDRLQTSLPLDDIALRWWVEHTCTIIQHRSSLSPREITINAWSSGGAINETMVAMFDVFEEALQPPSSTDMTDIFVPKGLKGREMQSFLEALRSVSAQIGRGLLRAVVPRINGSTKHSSTGSASTLSASACSRLHQPSKFAALYESLKMGSSDVSGCSLVDMMASLSDDFMGIIRRYFSQQGDFGEMIQADTGLDVKVMLKQWKSAKTLPTIRVEQVAGGYALAQEGMDVGYTQIPIEIKVLNALRETRTIVVGNDPTIVETSDLVAIAYSPLYRVVYRPEMVNTILEDYMRRPWILTHPDLIAIIRDNDNLSALETTLAPTPWIMLNRKQPSLKICERVLGVLGKEETEHEAVANTVVRREAQAIRDSLLYC